MAPLPAPAGAGTQAPRGVTATPLFDHIVVIIMENHTYDEALQGPFTDTLASRGVVFSNSHGVIHPSLPNYLALWAGSYFGVANDNCPAPGSPYTAENLGHACESAGISWRAYSEGLPGAGSTVCSAQSGLYARKHAPWTHFSNLDHGNERPYGDLAADLAAGTLPRLAFIIPNQCDDSHNNCGQDPVLHGDDWLALNVPTIVSSMGTRGLLILTWDEDDNSSGNHILTVFNSNLVGRDTTCTQTISHYTVLRTICEGLGLAPFGAAAAESSITGVWLGPTAGNPAPPLAALRLGAPRPNPSTGAVSARLDLPAATRVSAEIEDLAGRRVRRLFSGTASGAVNLAWDGTRQDGGVCSGGVYFLRVSAEGARLQRKLIRIR